MKILMVLSAMKTVSSTQIAASSFILPTTANVTILQAKVTKWNLPFPSLHTN